MILRTLHPATALSFRVGLLLALSFLPMPRPALAGPDALRRQLDAIVDGFRGTLGYSFHHLKTGDRLQRHGDELFPTASTIKLAMLCAAMEKQQGEIGYDETRPLTREDRQNGTGLLQNYTLGTPVELRTLLHLMITVSDNILSIYTREAKDTRASADNEQDQAIRAISRAIWHHYHPRIRWSPPAGTGAFYDVWPRIGTLPARKIVRKGERLPGVVPPLLVDDFEGGALTSAQGTPWSTYTDAPLGGKSTIQANVVESGANGTKKALRLTGTVTDDFRYGFAGIAVALRPREGAVDLTGFKGIRFYARGDGGRYWVGMRCAGVLDGNHFGKEFLAPAAWTRIDVSFAALKQSPFFGQQVRWTGTDIEGVLFSTTGAPRDSYRLEVDEVQLY